MPFTMSATAWTSMGTVAYAAEGNTDVNINEEYKYVYAGLTWAQYWESEGVFAAGSTASSDEVDTRLETDKGAFDVVTRATANHGLHRGSYQCMATVYDEDGNAYELSAWSSDGSKMILTDGTELGFNRGTITKTDGTTVAMKYYEVSGIKYVPVAVKASDYEEFTKLYPVTENAQQVLGGYSENNLNAYSATANVTADTNGLKIATKNADGTFSFSARKTGTDSGLQDAAQKKVDESKITVTVKEADGIYGEFLRVDLTGDAYGDLGANMQTVRWDYYGDDSTYSSVKASYGTKFAADNWMHKAMGIQLGLTDSLRCQLPEGTDGTGYWAVTVYALGYEDYTFKFTATEDNIVKAEEEEKVDTAALSAVIQKAEALKETDYTADSWKAMQAELQEAKDELANPKTQAIVDEAISHLNAAIEELVQVPQITQAASTVSLAKKTVTYTGKAVNMTGAVVTGSTGKVTYTYYSDSACKKALKTAPTNAGTYYVKATVAADANYKAATSKAAQLVINPAASKVTLSAKTVTYTGKAVNMTGAKATGSTGKVTYTYYSDKAGKKKISAPKNVGTYYVKATVAATTNYKTASSNLVRLTIKAAKPTITVKTTAKTLTVANVAKKAQTFNIGASVNSKGSISYKKISGSSKITVNSSTGKVTVQKGTKKGTYTAKVTISTKAKGNYTTGTKTVTVTVKVK
jgi:hypothetical protein